MVADRTHVSLESHERSEFAVVCSGYRCIQGSWTGRRDEAPSLAAVNGCGSGGAGGCHRAPDRVRRDALLVTGISLVNSANGLGAGPVTVASGATLGFVSTVAGLTPPNLITIASGGGLSARTNSVTFSTATLTLPSAGTLILNDDDVATAAIAINGNYPTLTGDMTFQLGGTRGGTVGTVTLSGAIDDGAGSFKLIVNGGAATSGTLLLASNNTYDGGTFVNKGTLHTTGPAGATSSVLGTGAVTLAAGTTLNLRNNGAASGGTTAYANDLILAGSAAVSVDRIATSSSNMLTMANLTFGADTTLTETFGNSYAFAIPGAVTLNGVNGLNNAGTVRFTGAVGEATVGSSLVKSGAGILVISNANSFTGGVTINAGTIHAANSGSLGSPTPPILIGNTTGSSAASLVLTTPGVNIANPITVQANADPAAITLSGTNTTGISTFSGPVALGKDVTVNQSTGAMSLVFSGKVTGAGTLTKIGAGIVQLTDVTNDFGGAGKTITLSAGLLSVP